MLVLLCFMLIVISILHFLLGYAFLNDKAEDLLMWSFTGKVEKEVTDKEGYKKQQGKHLILMGTIFLLVPISVYLINKSHLNNDLLYIWLLVFVFTVILNVIQVRKHFK